MLAKSIINNVNNSTNWSQLAGFVGRLPKDTNLFGFKVFQCLIKDGNLYPGYSRVWIPEGSKVVHPENQHFIRGSRLFLPKWGVRIFPEYNIESTEILRIFSCYNPEYEYQKGHVHRLKWDEKLETDYLTGAVLGGSGLYLYPTTILGYDWFTWWSMSKWGPYPLKYNQVKKDKSVFI